MHDPIMLGWLRLTGAVEVVRTEGIRDMRTFLAEDQWEVWVTNGGTGEAREGTRLAVCATEQDAELIAYVLRKEQARTGPPSPLTKPCRDCGAEVTKACRPIGGEPERSLGYHDARYADAGWPMDNG